MKKVFIIGATLLLFLPTTHDPRPTTVLWAEDTPPVHKIGIVNVGRLFEQYEKTKVSDEELGRVSQSKQEERERLVSEIKSLKEEFLLLNEEARSERQKLIEDKMKGLVSFDQQAKGILRRKRDDALKGILDEIEATVATYAKANGFELILTEQAVLYGVEAIDVTDEVLKQLNIKGQKKT